jgi:hypothetical protein
MDANLIAKCKILSRYRCPINDAHHWDYCPYSHDDDKSALDLLSTETYIMLAKESEKYNGPHRGSFPTRSLSCEHSTFPDMIDAVMKEFR